MDESVHAGRVLVGIAREQLAVIRGPAAGCGVIRDERAGGDMHDKEETGWIEEGEGEAWA